MSHSGTQHTQLPGQALLREWHRGEIGSVMCQQLEALKVQSASWPTYLLTFVKFLPHFCEKFPFFLVCRRKTALWINVVDRFFIPVKMLRRRQNQRKIMRRKRKPLRCGATTTLMGPTWLISQEKTNFFLRWEIFHVTSHFFPQIFEAFNRMNVLQIGSLVGPLHALKSLWKC